MLVPLSVSTVLRREAFRFKKTVTMKESGVIGFLRNELDAVLFERRRIPVLIKTSLNVGL